MCLDLTKVTAYIELCCNSEHNDIVLLWYWPLNFKKSPKQNILSYLGKQIEPHSFDHSVSSLHQRDISWLCL